MSEYESEDEASIGRLEGVDLSDDDSDDSFNLLFSVSVTEIETNEIDNEFNEAVTEIEGKKSFECEKCGKICKSKGGLTKHTNSKHAEPKTADETCNLDKDTVDGFVEAIKARIIDEGLYDNATTIVLKDVTTTKALFTAVRPIYETFCKKKNQDKLLETFYGLIPRSQELLKCDDYRIANLVLIQLPDFLLGFYKSSTMTKKQNETPATLEPAERGPLSYIAGYIVSKLITKNRTKKGQSSDEIQAVLNVMKSTEVANAFISARTRGGLICPCDDLIHVVEVAELSFRGEIDRINETLRSIPTEVICNTVLESPVVKSLWENIVLSSGVDSSSVTPKLCLENIVKLYLKVRSFSYAKDYIAKYKIKEKQTKTKALRSELKRK